MKSSKRLPSTSQAAAAEVTDNLSETRPYIAVSVDREAAAAAGASGILVPTPVTRRAEVEAAPRRAATISEAVAQVLAGGW